MTAQPIGEPVDASAQAAQAAAIRRRARREFWLALVRRPGFIIGVLILVFWGVCGLLGERITPYDPFNYFADGGQLPPTAAHLFGTDRLGRDVLSRLMVGARDILIVAPLAALLGVGAGTVLGLVMGFYRGFVDDVLSRIVEAFLALPVVMVGLLVLTITSTSDILQTITFESRKLLVIYVVSLLFTRISTRRPSTTSSTRPPSIVTWKMISSTLLTDLTLSFSCTKYGNICSTS